MFLFGKTNVVPEYVKLTNMYYDCKLS